MSKFTKANQKAAEARLKRPISGHEMRIIKLICKQRTTRQIADTLGKSKRTIDNDRGFIIKKIGCINVVGIVLYAIRNKIVKA